MSIKLIPAPLSGHVDMIGSKSYGHRALIAASIANGVSTITGLPSSDDIHVTLEALKHFGIEYVNEKVHGKPWNYDGKPIPCMASGSSLRFFIPSAMILKKDVFFTGEQRLFERPLDVYEQVFQGLTFQKSNTSLHVKGPIPHGHYAVEGHKSSQFLTGLLFALPQLRRDSVIEMVTPLKSRSYVDITLEILKLANIHVVEKEPYFMIQGKQTFKPFEYHVEGDYSQASFFFVAATIGEEITVSNLNLNSTQGDKKIIHIIKQMGGDITIENNSVVVKPAATKGIDIDLEDIPDLGPILMVLASLSKGQTRFQSVERLRYKESDRLAVMMDILDQFKVTYSYDKDCLTITGRAFLEGNKVFETHGDHRIAMALAIASIKCSDPIVINHPEVVSKSYPEFFEVFKQLGGSIHEPE
ncbi:MAG: 3-phosphoshikimate 1-carboxyvinyltransferase [Acholeplasmataceae bacterium]